MSDTNTHIAELIWFDVPSGEGEVLLGNEILHMHYTSICGIQRNGYICPSDQDQVLFRNLKSGDKCKIIVYENLYSRRVEHCEFDLESIG